MIRIPYGKSFIEFEEGNAPVLTSRIGELKAAGSGLEIVRAAMAEPIDSPRLSELARGKKNCVVIVSDHTRPVPSRDILPPMLEELRAGSPDIEVTLLVATGFHRPTSTKELEDKLGREIMESCRVVVHDCRDAASNVHIGTLPSGAPCVVDRLAVETELLVAEGFIEPHFFAGFSGGRKSVLPGVADQVTVLGNHCSRFIDSPYARTGVLDGNPIHEDMLAAAEMAKLAFIVNVVIDEEKKTVAAFAGNFRTAHRRGCDYMLDYFKVAPVPSEIVVTSNGGAPLDQNLYQCVKSMTAAEASCKPGGRRDRALRRMRRRPRRRGLLPLAARLRKPRRALCRADGHPAGSDRSRPVGEPDPRAYPDAPHGDLRHAAGAEGHGRGDEDALRAHAARRAGHGPRDGQGKPLLYPQRHIRDREMIA